MKKSLLFFRPIFIGLIMLFSSGWVMGQTAPGDIAFIAFNGDAGDDFAFVTLVDIPSGTLIYFTDNEWNGSAFTDLNEGEFTWTATSNLSAGSIVVISSTSGNSPTVNTGTIAGSGLDIGASDEWLYALLSAPAISYATNPVFLAAVASDAGANWLLGTSLTQGTNAIDFNNDYDGFKYTGVKSGEAAFADYLPLIMNSAYWQQEISDGALIKPISTTSFTIPITAAVTFNVDMNASVGFNPTLDEVFISGDFNTWAEPGTDLLYKLTDADSDGIYSVTLTIDGGNIEYKYFKNGGWAGGEWTGDPNRAANITADATIADIWADYQISSTFNVDMSLAANFDPLSDLIYISGGFVDSWTEPGTNPFYLMTDIDGNMIYTVTVEMNAPISTVEYKYFKNTGWAGGDVATNRSSAVSLDAVINDIFGFIDGDFISVNLPYSQDFNRAINGSNIALAGFTNENIAAAGVVKWKAALFSSNLYAQMTSYNSTGADESWLITPGINLDNTPFDEFSFDVNVGYWTHAGLAVKISFNYDQTLAGISTATWTDITANFTIPVIPTAAYGTLASAGTMDLSSLTGIVSIAFVYTGDKTTLQTTTYQVDNILVQAFTPTTTWTGTTDTDWATAGNWSEGIPTILHDIVIPGSLTNYPVLTGSGTCNNMEIAAGGNVTISSTGTLSHGGFATMHSDATQSSSLILMPGFGYSGSGIVSYQRYITATDWHLLGSTTEDQIIDAAFLSANLITGMKDYVQSADNWNIDYLTSAPNVNFTYGVGYATKVSTAGVITFTGNIATESKTVELTRPGITKNSGLSSAGFGWNLLGNPFTSAINATVTAHATDNLITANTTVLDPSYAALYIWDQASASYKIINNAGDGTLVQNYLQVGQGFFVKSVVGGGSFTITSAMQSHQTAIAFKSVAESTWAGITLNAETSAAKASTQMLYQDNMSRGLDVSFDAGVFKSNPEFALYSRLLEDNGVDFGLQCLPIDYENLVVPIGLDAKSGEIIKFTAASVNIPEDFAIVLEDRSTNSFTVLSYDGEYTVQLTADSDGIGRFFLRTSLKSTLGIGTLSLQNAFQVFTNPMESQLLIRGEAKANTTARIYSITGKLVNVVNLAQVMENKVSFNENAGVYIVQIMDENGTFTQKFSWVK
jgi:hypothetical protein